MTLLYATGFDLFSSTADMQAIDNWVVNGGGGGGTADLLTTSGRSGGACLRTFRGTGAGNGVIGHQRNFDTVMPASTIVGVAVSLTTTNSLTSPIVLYDRTGAAFQLALTINSNDGSLSAVRGNGTVLGTSSAGFVTPGGFHYVEMASTISTTVGAVTVKVDGVTALTLSGVNTQVSANANWNSLVVGYGSLANVQGSLASNAALFDDIYICSSAGAINNTFLGDVRVVGSLANSAGTTANLTKVGSAATNWQSVSDKPNDGDTTYVTSATPGTYDTYAVADLPPATASVLAVIGRSIARRDDAGVRTLSTRVRSNGVEADSPSSTALTGVYAMVSQVMELDPTTAAAWLVANVNSGEFGPKVAS